jgi:hypothetical protein
MSVTGNQIKVLAGAREEARTESEFSRARLERDFEQRVSWYERLETQVAVLETVLAKNVAVFEEMSGEKYIPRAIALADAQKAKAAKQAVSDDGEGRADRIMKKLGIKG